MKGMTPGSVADVNFLAGRTGMNHRERLMSLAIQVIPLVKGYLVRDMDVIRSKVVAPLMQAGKLTRVAS